MILLLFNICVAKAAKFTTTQRKRCVLFVMMIVNRL